MEAKITKTYLGSTGTNYKTETRQVNGQNVTKVITTETATFHVDFPDDFVNSTNRRFITVMSPRLVWGAKTVNNVHIEPSLPITVTKDSRIADNMYIMHCSFIHRDPYHDKAIMNVNDPKRKYKKYEYKGCEDGFDIIFTDYFPAFDLSGWTIGNRVNGNLPNWNGQTADENVLTSYFQQAFPNYAALAATLADQCMTIYYNIILGSAPDDLVFYRNNQRFKTNITMTDYATDYDMYDIVFYVIEQNGLEQQLQLQRSNPDTDVIGDYRVYITQTHYIDPNLNRYVTYSRYIQYKILKDSVPWYYYAEFMVEY